MDDVTKKIKELTEKIGQEDKKIYEVYVPIIKKFETAYKEEVDKIISLDPNEFMRLHIALSSCVTSLFVEKMLAVLDLKQLKKENKGIEKIIDAILDAYLTMRVLKVFCSPFIPIQSIDP
jgi:hypothetical protein